MTERGTYIFAVTLSPGAYSKLAGVRMPETFGPLRLVGVGPGEAKALVSSYDGPSSDEIPRPEMLRHLVMHQSAIELATKHISVLPVRFFTVVTGDEVVEAALEASSEPLAKAWTRFKDFVELDVAVTWDLSSVFGAVAADPEVVRARLEAENADAVDRQQLVVRTGQLVAGKLNERRSMIQSHLLEALNAIYVDVLHNELASDELAVNSAFLVPVESVAAFDEALAEVDKKFAGEYTFRRVGPLPVYSFATLKLNQITPQRLSQARQILGLATGSDESAIESAYRSAAVMAHPDVNPGDGAAAAKFAELGQARKDLVAAVRHGNTAESAAGSRYFSVERSLGRGIMA